MKQDLRIAVMAVIVNEDKILIGSSPRDGGYKFPQGGLDNKETAKEAIFRELYEELNLVLRESDIVSIFTNRVGYDYPNEDRYIYKRQELYVVLVNYHDQMTLEPQDDEFDSLIWIKPKDLKNYNSSFRAKAYEQALKLCGLV